MIDSMSRRPALPGLLALGLVVAGVIGWVFTDRGERPLDEGLGRVAVEADARPAPSIDIEPAQMPRDAGAAGVEDGPPVEGAREPVAVEGTGSLTLYFVSAETGAPVEGEVDLWRLGVPEEIEWTAGDVRIARVELEAGVASFDDLKTGTYRVAALMQRRDAAYLPPFEVVAGLNAETLAVEVAARRDVQLDVLALDGARIPGRVEFLDRGTTMHFGSWRHPEWAQPRRRKLEGDTLIGVGGAGGGRYHTPHRSWGERERGERGFVLERLRSSRRTMTYVHKLRLRVERSVPLALDGAWSLAEARAYTGRGDVGFEDTLEGTGGLSELAEREQRWMNDVRLEDTGSDAYVIVAVDPVDIAWRIEGVEGFSELEVLSGLEIELVASPAEAREDAQVLLSLTLDGELRLSTRWFPLREPIPRLAVRASSD